MADTASPDLSDVVHHLGPLPRGSVVVLRGVYLAQADIDWLSAELVRASGHDQIVLVMLHHPDASLAVVHAPEAMASLLGMAAPPAPVPEPKRVQDARAWRDQTAGRYGPNATPEGHLIGPDAALEGNNRAWWADLDALLQYIDQLTLTDLLGLARPTICDCAPSAHTMDSSPTPPPQVPHPNPHLPPLLGPDGCLCGEPEGAPVHQVPVPDLGDPEADQRPGRWDDLPSPVGQLLDDLDASILDARRARRDETAAG